MRVPILGALTPTALRTTQTVSWAARVTPTTAGGITSGASRYAPALAVQSPVPTSLRPSSQLPMPTTGPMPSSPAASPASSPASSPAPAPMTTVETAPPSYSEPTYSYANGASAGGGGSSASASEPPSVETLTPNGAAVSGGSKKALLLGVVAVGAFLAWKKFKG